MHKPTLPHEELTDVIDLALFAGQLLLQYGAEAARIEETVHHIGTGLGCDWMDILVSPNVIIVTTISGSEFRTKVRRVVRMGVNFAIIDAVNELSHGVSTHQLDRFKLRGELDRISRMPDQYNHWLTATMVGAACAAFSQLFGGGAPEFLVTYIAASSAMFVRQKISQYNFNPYMMVILVAFFAGLISGAAALFDFANHPEIAVASSVLLLVPGVPLITAAEDLIQGYNITGISRGVLGAIISLCIALGLVVAMHITGISSL